MSSKGPWNSRKELGEGWDMVLEGGVSRGTQEGHGKVHLMEVVADGAE